MARGFESKSVQEQWQDAEAAQEQRKKKKKSADEIEHDTKRDSLQLSRTRIARELEETTSAARQAQLRAALSFLDEELAKLA
jgi:hypothetical protein